MSSGAGGIERLFPRFRDARVLSDEAGLFVIDKPSGLVVHGGDVQLGGDLVTRLRDVRLARGQDPYLGVHSRLDVGTSGVLVFTTERDVNAALARDLERGDVARRYLACVERAKGERLRASGRLEHRLLADKRGARVVASGGDLAVCDYRILEERGARALVELSPETGRMHQLRVQLAAVGAPIAGDRQYGGAPATRLLLHSASRQLLGRRFEAPLPEEFAHWLEGRATLGTAAHRREKLLDAACARSPLCERADTFRVVNGESDGLPGVTLDRYGDFAALYASDPEAEEAAPELAAILREHGVRGVYFKRRDRKDRRRSAAEQLEPEVPLAGEVAPAPLEVRERERRFGVELADGFSTGLFVDQRDNRDRVTAFAAGRDVLNLFSYTGSFSVAAALGGAARVTTLDLSGRALDRARDNFVRNGLDPAAHEFVQADALEWLRRAAKRPARYGLVVLDPPSFATVGSGTFRFDRDYVELATSCLRILAPGGALLAVTNHRKTSVAQFRRALGKAAEQAGLAARLRDLPSGIDCPPHWSGPEPSKSVWVEAAAPVGRMLEARRRSTP